MVVRGSLREIGEPQGPSVEPRTAEIHMEQRLKDSSRLHSLIHFLSAASLCASFDVRLCQLLGLHVICIC